MKYGMSVPNFGWFGDIDLLTEVAVEAEESGWDGFFLWDHLMVIREESWLFVDPWIALASIACNTTKLTIGPLVTPLPRRRPWKLSREIVSLDHLSKGRTILGVGIGAPPDVEFAAFGEEANSRIRAEKLDEGLDILLGLWSGETFSYAGKHYQLEEVTFNPKPKQEPRIPIWVGGGYPFKAPFHRAARFDGVAPVHSEWPAPVTAEHLEFVLDIVKAERGNLNNYEVVISGETSGNDSAEDREIIDSWEKMGVTWWLEDINGMRADIDELRERIRTGPPSS